MHVDDVKHLTCYYWKHMGGCQWDDDRCLYAHYETGKDAEEPKRKLPGGPPVAGKNAKSSSPAYNNWRGLRMKVEPEPEEPIHSVDVPLFALVKPWATKKSGLRKEEPLSGVAASNPCKVTQSRVPKQDQNGRADDSQAPHEIKVVASSNASLEVHQLGSKPTVQDAAPKSWSQVLGSNTNQSSKVNDTRSKNHNDSTSEPFVAQIRAIDLAATDLRLSTANPIDVSRKVASKGMAPQQGHSRGKEDKSLPSKRGGFTGQDARTEVFEKRARYPEVLNMMKAPLRNPADAVVDTFTRLNLRPLRSACVPPPIQDLCIIRYQIDQKLLTLTLWVKLFKEDCADLRRQGHPMAVDFAAWGSWRVESVEKTDGPKLRARLRIIDEDIITRIRQLPHGNFL